MVAPSRLRRASTTRSAKVMQPISQPASRATGRQVSSSMSIRSSRRKQRGLAGMDADRQHQPVGEPRRLAHDIEMAVGDRVERAGIEGNSRHGGGLARLLAPKRHAARMAASCGMLRS